MNTRKKSTVGYNEDRNYTHFHQLFDIRLNLSSVLKCSFISSDAKRTITNQNCEHIAKSAQFLSKNSRFDNCLTFLNINQRSETFKVYELHKSSRIEFEFLGKNNF